MLRIRGLLIAVVVLAAIGGGMYWSNKHQAAEANKPAAGAPPKILQVPTTELQKIEIRKSGSPVTIVDRQSGKWEMTAPEKLQTSAPDVGGMIEAFSDVTADRLVEDKAANLSQFGLANPALDVIASWKNGKTSELQFGDETPTGGTYYAKLAGDPRVFTVSNATRANFDKSWNDLRDKRLLTFDQSKVTGIELDAKGETFAFGKDNQNEWQIVKPQPMRADGGQFADLMGALSGASMEPSAAGDERTQVEAAYASGSPVVTAKVSDASGTQELMIRKGKDEGYYAKSSVLTGAYRVPSSLAEKLDKPVSDFRNKKLFDFGWDNPVKIDIRDGANRTIYVRSGETWFLAGRQMDAGTMSDLVEKLRDLSATGFPAKGFTASTLEISVTSKDGKREETVEISKSDDSYIARRVNEPSLYQLDASAITELQKALSAVKPAALPSATNAKKK